VLVRRLGELVGGTAVPGEDGQVGVSVNGISMVSGTTAQRFTVSGGTDISTAAADPPTIRWGTTAVPVESGAASGRLAALRTDLPTLSARLDAVAGALRDAVNALHTTGYAADGTTGAPFFSGTGAGDLAVVPTTPQQLAVRAADGIVDGSVAMRIGDLADDAVAASVLGGQPGPSVRWRELTSSFGVELQSVQAAAKVQAGVVSASEDAVQASAGVNLDEEMTNMLLFQRAYQASARVITTVDEMLDTLVNRTGVVGR
jgi:flagellar hook-associated protein 1 FlgK